MFRSHHDEGNFPISLLPSFLPSGIAGFASFVLREITTGSLVHGSISNQSFINFAAASEMPARVFIKLIANFYNFSVLLAFSTYIRWLFNAYTRKHEIAPITSKGVTLFRRFLYNQYNKRAEFSKSF